MCKKFVFPYCGEGGICHPERRAKPGAEGSSVLQLRLPGRSFFSLLAQDDNSFFVTSTIDKEPVKSLKYRYGTSAYIAVFLLLSTKI